jgi:hypothetical protein
MQSTAEFHKVLERISLSCSTNSGLTVLWKMQVGSVKIFLQTAEDLRRLNHRAHCTPPFIKYVEDVVSPHIIRLCLWSCLTNILDHLERAQQCSAPDCFKLISDHPLKPCTGCGLTRYCSRRCQKHAWRHVVSHRNVCSELSRLCAGWDIPKVGIRAELDERPMMPGREYLQGPAASLLLNHFRALALHKMNTLGTDVYLQPVR